MVSQLTALPNNNSQPTHNTVVTTGRRLMVSLLTAVLPNNTAVSQLTQQTTVITGRRLVSAYSHPYNVALSTLNSRFGDTLLGITATCVLLYSVAVEWLTRFSSAPVSNRTPKSQTIRSSKL